MSSTEPIVSPPRFCPQCRRPESELIVSRTIPDAPLCACCGSKLLPQGYCPVCEQYVCLPVGAVCPKHDLPLEGLPEDAPGAGAPIVWETVARYPRLSAAQAPQLRLEAEGIPTFLQGANTSALAHPAIAEVRLQVPRDLRGRCPCFAVSDLGTRTGTVGRVRRRLGRARTGTRRATADDHERRDHPRSRRASGRVPRRAGAGPAATGGSSVGWPSRHQQVLSCRVGFSLPIPFQKTMGLAG